MGYRKPLLFAALTATVAILTYTGFWFYARGVALDVIADWVAKQRNAGYRITHGPPETGGYPFVVRITLDGVSAAPAAPAAENWRWRGERLGIEIRPWNFRRIRLEAFGAQHVSWRRDGAVHRIALNATETVAIATIADNGRVGGATLRVQDLRIASDAGDIRMGEFWLDAKAAATRPVAHTDTAFTLLLAASDAVLPAGLQIKLGREIKTLRADLKVLGAIAGGPRREAVEAWRKDGGTLEVNWLHFVWGAVDLRAKGTLALDAEHRPLGALTADIRGHAAALDALRAASVLSENTTNLAKIGLALLARRPPDGGAPVLTVPVTAQSGKLYLGPVKILDLPRIRF